MSDDVQAISPVFFEQVLIKFLFSNVEIRDKVFPFLNVNIFDDALNINIIKKILYLYSEYQKFPTIPELKLAMSDDEKSFNRFFNDIMNIDLAEYTSEFLLNEIEDYFKKKMIANICADTAIGLQDEIDKLHDVPDKFREALSFGFDTNVGLDVFNDYERFYDALHNKDRVISTGLPTLDSMIDGGFHEKSLTLMLAACVTEDTPVNIRFRKKC